VAQRLGEKTDLQTMGQLGMDVPDLDQKIPKKSTNLNTVVFNMLTNVAKVLVNENIKERRRKLCSLMFFGRIL
jgi:hypothetical protein